MIGKDEMRELHPYINTGDILGGVWIPQVTYILSFDYAHLTPNPNCVENSRKLWNENFVRFSKKVLLNYKN